MVTSQSSSGALSGLRVIDLSRVLAGPYCGQMLGDHGAEVIKVEGPNGDDTRTWGPYKPDGESAYYESINRNKQNVELDLSLENDRSRLRKLITTADVVIENFKPGTMSRWGLDYERDLQPENPQLIYCNISGYGTNGPLASLPGYDAALQAYSGLMSVNGEADREPMRIGVPIVDMVTGILSFSGILLALHERGTSGLGQLVDCSLLDTSLALLHPHSAQWLTSGTLPVRTGGAHPSIAPYETFPTRNGSLFISAANDRQFSELAGVLEAPSLLADPRFATNGTRLSNVGALRRIITALLVGRDRDELAAALLQRGVAAAPVNTVEEALSSAQVQDRDMVVHLDGYRGVGIPIKLGRTPGSVRSAPASHGSDTSVVLKQIDTDL